MYDKKEEENQKKNTHKNNGQTCMIKDNRIKQKGNRKNGVICTLYNVYIQSMHIKR